jgi:hypothetical protein
MTTTEPNIGEPVPPGEPIQPDVAEPEPFNPDENDDDSDTGEDA